MNSLKNVIPYLASNYYHKNVYLLASNEPVSYKPVSLPLNKWNNDLHCENTAVVMPE